MLTTTTAIAALLLSAAQTGQSAPQTAPENAPENASTSPAAQHTALEADQLAKGRPQNAILALEERVEAAPEDPALLINLGIAHAQAGDSGRARALFERALVSSEPTALETAEGTVIDSRRLARKAMRMLERGEFTTRLTRRD